VLPVLSCAPRSMHGNVPVYQFPSQPLTPRHPSCPSYCISTAWRLCSPQSPNLVAISIQATKASIQIPVRRLRKAGCVESSRSSRTRTKLKTTTTHIHHISSSRPHRFDAQATSTDPLSRKAKQSKAKQSDKVPDFQSSTSA
jgi:hypothetical protein